MEKIIKYYFLSILTLLIYNTNFAESWQTKFEKSNYLETDNYESTINYFKQLEVYSDYAKLIKIGISPQGRDIYSLIINKDKIFDLKEISKSFKSIVLIQNGIHAGEIEGKDACMLLLRDILITKTKEDLLKNVCLIIIPVLNVDGHERISRYNRINQNGPTYMGWRTTANNLNLNRDYLKADALEIKAFIKLFNNINPDIFIDTHTTDGLDMQPVLTYSIEWQGNVTNVLSEWITKIFLPEIEKYMSSKQVLTAPYVNMNDYTDPSKGINAWVSSPKLSTGYAAIRNKIGILIETHSLKPYKDRVFATLDFLEGSIKIANTQNESIKNNSKLAKIENDFVHCKLKNPYPFSFRLTKDSIMYKWKGIVAKKRYSNIAGDTIIYYDNEKYEKEVPYKYRLEGNKYAVVPKYYIIPQEWTEVINILKLHGCQYYTQPNDTIVTGYTYKFKNVKFGTMPYEGRFQPSFDMDTIKLNCEIRKGDYLFPTDNNLLGILVYLLEPNTNDSFIKWGFFNAIFEQKEYYEIYSMVPVAERMYNENTELKNEFIGLTHDDKKFAENIYERLNYFYKNSDYFDKKFNVYPILKVF